MKIKFSKYHGCGNDFVIIDDIGDFAYSKLALAICNRRLGIGADGLLIHKAPFEMVFYNADGTLGTMCGNGLRCFALYIYNKTGRGELHIKTGAGLRQTEITDSIIKTNLGRPQYSGKILKIKDSPVDFIDQRVEGYIASAVYTGTEHLVIYANRNDISDIKAMALCNNKYFPGKVNVNFAEKTGENEFYVSTYERGVGWTDACGTGAAAVYALSCKKGLCKGLVKIKFKYESINVCYDSKENIIVSGPAQFVANGYYDYRP